MSTEIGRSCASFCEAVESAERRRHLLSAIRGNGAFGRFKTLAAAYHMLEEWYAVDTNYQ